MTKNIRKGAPETATMFRVEGDKIGYYKWERQKVMKYIEGFGWMISSSTKAKDLHKLTATPQWERILVAGALVIFWAFIIWAVSL